MDRRYLIDWLMFFLFFYSFFFLFFYGDHFDVSCWMRYFVPVAVRGEKQRKSKPKREENLENILPVLNVNLRYMVDQVVYAHESTSHVRNSLDQISPNYFKFGLL